MIFKKKKKQVKLENVWTDECEELLAEWSKSIVLQMVTRSFKKRIIEHGIIVFQFQ